MSSFTRALSPMAASFAAATNVADEDSARSARLAVFQATSSVEEVVALVPQDFREVLRAPLLEVAAKATKLQAARGALAKLQAHQAANTLPPQARAKAPVVQITKDFDGDEKAATHKAALLEAHKQYQLGLLAEMVKTKSDEVQFLELALTPDVLWTNMHPLLNQRVEILRIQNKLPTFTEQEPVERGAPKWLKLTGWEPSPALEQLYRTTLADCVVYAYRIISIVESRAYAQRLKAKGKEEIREAADTEMADGTRPGPSIQSLIDKAVSARLGKPQPKGKGKKVSVSSRAYSIFAYTSSLERQEEVLGIRPGHSSTDGPRPPQPPQTFREALASSSRETYDEFARSWRQLSGSWERTRLAGQPGEAVLGLTPPRTFRYDNPASYPDQLLMIPFPTAIRYIILNTPVNIILASQFRNNVHRSPGVNIPKEIELDLSVGMRYMFHSQRNSLLIMSAWNDFVRRIRWRAFFTFRKQDNSEYDPDYELDVESTTPPPRLPPYMEHGISMGRLFVQRTIAKIPAEEDPVAYQSLAPNRNRLQEFLTRNNYIVTSTDKNLGIAVSERTWVINKSLEILANKNDYKAMHPLTVQTICDKQCDEMNAIAYLAEIRLSNGEQLGPFFRSRVTPQGDQHKLPIFYGIPKIHKEPVKFRPIIPCHSAIQNPAAKYVSKRLKPIIKSAPAIIHGTKDLAIKLSKLKLDKSRKWFIVTGDVVAFYPNIPLDPCLDIVASLYEEHYYAGKATEADDLKELEIFIRCLLVANKNLLTRFQDMIYRQERGLAMGVADSPDLANLYGWFFERKLNVMENPQIPFYGRYIDDVFGLVYASSEQQALQIMSHIKFDGCVIEWNVSDQFQPFLDMTVYKDEFNSVQHMPYRKARNHQERIPWISHHPLDVKRGTYLGEMSRLATLSSTHSTYSGALEGLATLYIARGYPSELVHAWTRDNKTKRWENRLNEERREPGDVLVLKSEFNTAWNWFSAHELGSTVLGYWNEYVARAATGSFSFKFPKFSADRGGLDHVDNEFLSEFVTSSGLADMPDITKTGISNRRMIVSRKRTRNLFDLTSLWKKTVLAKMEEQVLDEDHNDAPPASPVDLPERFVSDLEMRHLDVIASSGSFFG